MLPNVVLTLPMYIYTHTYVVAAYLAGVAESDADGCVIGLPPSLPSFLHLPAHLMLPQSAGWPVGNNDTNVADANHGTFASQRRGFHGAGWHVLL